MDFDSYQSRAMAFAKYPSGQVPWLYPALALTEESGEVAGKLAKLVRDGGGVLTDEVRLAVIKELGDVLWNVAALATEMDTDLTNVALTNLNKLDSRAARGKISGSGDER